MLSHVYVGVTDFQRAFAFYSAVMDTLGFPLRFSEPEKPLAAWMPAHCRVPLFVLDIHTTGSLLRREMVRWLHCSRKAEMLSKSVILQQSQTVLGQKARRV